MGASTTDGTKSGGNLSGINRLLYLAKQLRLYGQSSNTEKLLPRILGVKNANPHCSPND